METTVEPELVLLDAWPSTLCMRPKIALAEKGIEHECRQQEFWPHKKSPLLLQMNPVHKKVPVLIHDGKPICESNIIVLYIDETWKDVSPLMPSDPYLRSQALFWADYLDKKFSDAGTRIWFTKGEELEKATVEFIDFLKVLEGQLGESFGYVDISLVPMYCYFYTFEMLGNFSVEKECLKLIEWGKRCVERESVSKTLADPHVVYEMAMERIKELGL